MSENRSTAEALRGTLDLLILKTLSLEPMHGWGITQRIRELSDGLLDVNQGSLYPALQRLEGKGLVVSGWTTTENNRRARYYRLTRSGEEAIVPEEESWRRHVQGVALVLEAR
ncbi:MAG TPA: PadR family transcriptional regulator [Longimicrobiales bacterium]|nr:PadR family transcriptional regulator [Longimicrobiales bacterium]